MFPPEFRLKQDEKTEYDDEYVMMNPTWFIFIFTAAQS